MSTVCIKVVVVLTVVSCNIVVYVCLGLLLQLLDCGAPQQAVCAKDATKHMIGLVCIMLICVLVLVAATLDNISWWTSSFPDAFMSANKTAEFLHRLSVTNPGCKVTIQQDFFTVSGTKSFPKMRRKSMEMYKPQAWIDTTNYNWHKTKYSSVIKINVEISAMDIEAKADLNKFIHEMIMENSFGEYDRRMLSSVSIEARIPKLSLFQGLKIPQISVDNKSESINLLSAPRFKKILGHPVRIFVYSDSSWTGCLFPLLFNLKMILFFLVLLMPALGTFISVILADKTENITVRKKYSRRQNINDLLEENPSVQMQPRVRLTGSSSQESDETFRALSPISESTSLFVSLPLDERRTSDTLLDSVSISESTSGLIDEYSQDADDEMTICTETDTELGICVIDQPPPYSALMDKLQYQSALMDKSALLDKLQRPHTAAAPPYSALVDKLQYQRLGKAKSLYGPVDNLAYGPTDKSNFGLMDSGLLDQASTRAGLELDQASTRAGLELEQASTPSYDSGIDSPPKYTDVFVGGRPALGYADIIKNAREALRKIEEENGEEAS